MYLDDMLFHDTMRRLSGLGNRSGEEWYRGNLPTVQND